MSRLSMTPIVTPVSGRRQYLVMFEAVQSDESEADSQQRERGPAAGAGSHNSRTICIAAKEHLRVVLEEHQAAVEELRSSNEEIQSSQRGTAKHE